MEGRLTYLRLQRDMQRGRPRQRLLSSALVAARVERRAVRTHGRNARHRAPHVQHCVGVVASSLVARPGRRSREKRQPFVLELGRSPCTNKDNDN